MSPPRPVNFTALVSRLTRICLIARSSAQRCPKPSSISISRRISFSLQAKRDEAHHGVDGRDQIDGPLEEPELPQLDLRDVEDVVDDAEEMRAGLVDIARVAHVLQRAERAQHLRGHHLREADDGVERRAELVAHVGEELRLGAIVRDRLLLRLPRRVLAALAQRDVVNGIDIDRARSAGDAQPLIGIDHRLAGGDLHLDRLTARSRERDVDRRARADAQRVGRPLQRTRARRRRRVPGHDDLYGPPDARLRLVAEHGRRGRVQRLDDAALVRDDDAVEACLHRGLGQQALVHRVHMLGVDAMGLSIELVEDRGAVGDGNAEERRRGLHIGQSLALGDDRARDDPDRDAGGAEAGAAPRDAGEPIARRHRNQEHDHQDHARRRRRGGRPLHERLVGERLDEHRRQVAVYRHGEIVAELDRRRADDHALARDGGPVEVAAHHVGEGKMRNRLGPNPVIDQERLAVPGLLVSCESPGHAR